MTPFFGKRCFFDMGEKVGITNCVSEKLCFAESTLFRNKKCTLNKTENL